jgi:S1-C subfamily serine protease
MFRMRISTTILTACAAFLLTLRPATGQVQERPAPAAPSLQAVKLVDYSKEGANVHPDSFGYWELRDLLDACRTYSNGLGALPKFHEPIATRGESGTAVFKKASPSVVMVLTANFKNDQISESGLGTGAIIDAAGYVLTNWHVIHGFESGVVFFKPVFGTEPDQNAAYGIRLVAQDEQADLALLKIVKPPAGLVPVRFAQGSSIEVAEDIHVIGHPHGLLWSYTTGVVSQVRDNYTWKYADGSEHVAKVLQLQTAINPGNSGGPVLNSDAEMLGLIAMSQEGQNLDYAVHIDVIKDFVSKSLALKTRGVASTRPSEKGTVSFGKTSDGLSVTKTVFADLVSFSVRSADGAPIELIAETTEGAVLTGKRPNAFGGYSEWTYKTDTGKTVLVKSSGVGPEVVTTATER